MDDFHYCWNLHADTSPLLLSTSKVVQVGNRQLCQFIALISDFLMKAIRIPIWCWVIITSLRVDKIDFPLCLVDRKSRDNIVVTIQFYSKEILFLPRDNHGPFVVWPFNQHPDSSTFMNFIFTGLKQRNVLIPANSQNYTLSEDEFASRKLIARLSSVLRIGHKSQIDVSGQHEQLCIKYLSWPTLYHQCETNFVLLLYNSGEDHLK